ncbi:MAG TPA: hypothetical protein VFF52_21430 [Isosphaeraceae bacterium]|nr:hypothetical protein [Isosphaeraceae bacterium]
MRISPATGRSMINPVAGTPSRAPRTFASHRIRHKSPCGRGVRPRRVPGGGHRSYPRSTGTVRFQVAAGPWKTIATWGKHPGAVGSRFGPSYIHGDAIATQTGTTLSVTHDIQDKPVRLVAVDLDGKELPAEIPSVGGAKDFRQLVVEFDQPPERIKDFRLQTRPYEAVEIPRIALRRK